MKEFVSRRILDTKKEYSEDNIIESLYDCMEESFEKIEIYDTVDEDEKVDGMEISGSLRTPFTTVVSFVANLEISSTKDKVSIVIEGNSSINGWFWAFIIGGFIFPGVWLALAGLYLWDITETEKRVQKALKSMNFNKVDFDEQKAQEQSFFEN